jgi:hypothetical protein
MEKLIKGQRYWLDHLKDVSGVYSETITRHGADIDMFTNILPTPDERGVSKGYHTEADGSTIGFYSGNDYEKA